MTGLLMNCVFVGAGGFLGSVFRYLLGFLTPPDHTGFPFITFFINITGAFLIAFVMTYFTRSFEVNDHLLLFLRVGLCGGFTTFSAFTLESLQLIQKGDIMMAVLYIVSSCAVCLVAAAVGQVAGTHVGAN